MKRDVRTIRLIDSCFDNARCFDAKRQQSWRDEKKKADIKSMANYLKVIIFKQTYNDMALKMHCHGKITFFRNIFLWWALTIIQMIILVIIVNF